ncbi:hypothetical protein M758_UG017400 [Ceratodon purpureus]|nr:hypothetical protein M758_UG017400 [Ceratodon purpureus]
MLFSCQIMHLLIWVCIFCGEISMFQQHLQEQGAQHRPGRHHPSILAVDTQIFEFMDCRSDLYGQSFKSITIEPFPLGLE